MKSWIGQVCLIFEPNHLLQVQPDAGRSIRHRLITATCDQHGELISDILTALSNIEKGTAEEIGQPQIFRLRNGCTVFHFQPLLLLFYDSDSLPQR